MNKIARTAPQLEAEVADHAGPIRLKIEGLTPDYSGGEGEFILYDCTPLSVDYTLVVDGLVQQNVPRDIVERAVEELAETIALQTLSRELAKRIKRI